MTDFWQQFNDQIDLKCTLMHFELRDEFETLNRSLGQKLRAGTGAKWVYEDHQSRQWTMFRPVVLTVGTGSGTSTMFMANGRLAR